VGILAFAMSCALFVSAGSACDRAGVSGRTDSVAARPVARDTAAAAVAPPPPATVAPLTIDTTTPTRGADEALALYLAGSVYRHPVPIPDGLEWCPPPGPRAEDESDEGWEPDQYIAIERPRVLGIRVAPGDTSDDRRDIVAEVVRVARVGRGDGGWVAEPEVRPDTLVWTVMRRPTGGWGVCGPATKATGGSAAMFPMFLVTDRFAEIGEINSARWEPAGASWATVARIADSLRAATRR
jgi:hypothetical protein